MNDGQTDDEQGDTGEDLEASFLSFEGDLPGAASRRMSANVYRPYMSQ